MDVGDTVVVQGAGPIGLLTLAVPPEAWAVYAAGQPGAIVRKAADLAAFAGLAGDERITSLLIGSGLEPDGATADLVRTGTALSRPTVIDSSVSVQCDLGVGSLRAKRSAASRALICPMTTAKRRSTSIPCRRPHQ